jgi:N-acetyltransferase
MTKGALRIELADNLDAVRKLWKEYWGSLGLSETFQDFGRELQELPGKYSLPRGALVVGYIEGKPAGTVALRPLTDTACEAKRLYVRPEYRGRGIGRSLMNWIIQHARNLGYSTLRGDTLPIMSDALRMYRDMGFVVIDHPYSDTPTPGAIYIELSLSFHLQPVLKGQLVELRPLQPEDFHVLYAVASDPLIWEQHPAKDRYKEEVFQSFFREALESGGALIAIDSKNGQVIGSSRFHGYDQQTSEIEIGWTFLARSHWGGNYNAEMKQLMLRHAFKFVKSVIFVIGPQNLRSQKAVEKIGGIRVGSRPDGNVVYQIKSFVTAARATEPRP